MLGLNMQSITILILILIINITIAQYALPPILCFNKLVSLLSLYGGNDNDFEPIFDSYNDDITYQIIIILPVLMQINFYLSKYLHEIQFLMILLLFVVNYLLDRLFLICFIHYLRDLLIHSIWLLMSVYNVIYLIDYSYYVNLWFYFFVLVSTIESLLINFYIVLQIDFIQQIVDIYSISFLMVFYLNQLNQIFVNYIFVKMINILYK